MNAHQESFLRDPSSTKGRPLPGRLLTVNDIDLTLPGRACMTKQERSRWTLLLLAFVFSTAPATTASGADQAQQGMVSSTTTTSTATATTTITTVVTPTAITTTTIVTTATGTLNPYLSATARMQKHFEPSYLTLGGGINRTDTIDFPDMLYEAQIYVHYTWNDTAYREPPPEQGDDHVRIVVPIRLQVRQYRTDSSPVKTPSYNPGIRMYYTRSRWIDERGMFYLSAGYHHYSNGQSGPHYNADGTINTENGSFSTDYTELSLYWDRQKTWTKLNLRTYLVSNRFTWEPAQSHYYERGIAELTWRFDPSGQRLAPAAAPKDPKTAIQLTGGYKYGRDYVSPGVNASFKDNLQWTAEVIAPSQVICRKWKWKDIQLYVRYDRGYDYYNIHYQEKMERIQFGIVAKNN